VQIVGYININSAFQLWVHSISWSREVELLSRDKAAWEQNWPFFLSIAGIENEWKLISQPQHFLDVNLPFLRVV